MKRLTAPVLLVSALLVPPAGADFQVSPNSMTIALAGGEIVSAVVPPGKKPQCMGGRVLIANDGVRPFPTTLIGIVGGIDLDGSGKTSQSTHELPPLAANYQYQSNDQNLISLPNGDVIYQAAAISTAPTPEKAWGPVAFRNGVGPNARIVQVTWRSEDCGQTFTYVGKADPLIFSDKGLCGSPQGGGALNAAGQVIYDMGGTDGPRLDVERDTGKLILTYGCVGQHELGKQPATCNASFPLAPKSGKQFILSSCPLNMTYVVTSGDGGKTWQRAAKIVSDDVGWMWRGAAVPTKNGLAIAYSNGVFLGKKKEVGGYDFQNPPVTLPGQWGYDPTFPSAAINNVSPLLIKTNIIGPAMLARVPGRSDVVLAGVSQSLDVPVAIGKDKPPRTHGYSLYHVNIDTGEIWKIPPVMPLGKGTGDVIMHLTAIDLGTGPVLLYWYDVSTAKKTAVVRARIIFSRDFMSPDFTLSRLNGADAPFELRPAALANAYFYGDYKMAEGFAGPKPPMALMPKSYTFLPAWVQPDGVTHVARVDVRVPTVTTPQTAAAEKWVTINPVKQSAKGAKLSITAEQIKLLREHGIERRR